MIAFFAVIYGMYIKISTKTSINFNKVNSLALSPDQKVKSFEVIDNNKILITIITEDEIQGIIFDIDKQEIVQRIIK